MLSSKERLPKPDGKRGYGGPDVITHQGDDGGRVQATAQKGSQRYVTDQPAAYREREMFPKASWNAASDRALVRLGSRHPPIATDADLAAARPSRREPPEVCEPHDRSTRGSGRSYSEGTHQPPAGEREVQARQFLEGLELRCKRELATIAVIVERLLAGSIPGQPERPAPRS